jgi:hypothetical protein
MAVTGVTGKPEVVKLGDGYVEERYDYVDGGTWDQGDFIRLTTGGEIKVAGTTSTSPPQGMALYTVGTEVNEQAPVVFFDQNTIVSIPCVDGVAPEDLTKGVTYTLEYSSGVWGITSTTTNGCATVVGYGDDGIPWTDRYGSFDQDSTVDNNRVLVRFKRAILDTAAA